jgi:hypothetical protein
VRGTVTLLLDSKVFVAFEVCDSFDVFEVWNIFHRLAFADFKVCNAFNVFEVCSAYHVFKECNSFDVFEARNAFIN